MSDFYIDNHIKILNENQLKLTYYSCYMKIKAYNSIMSNFVTLIEY